MNITSAIVMILYISVVFIVGILSGRGGDKSQDSYFTGDKSFGPVASAISAGATNSSGWIYIGAVAYAYQVGVLSMWMCVGFILGGWIEYLVLARKLRAQGDELNANGISDYMQKRLESQWGGDAKIVKVVAAAIMVLFFIPYLSTQLTSAGKTVSALIDINYNVGLVFSAVFVIGFCYFGGYKSVVYTDMVQGLLMLFVLLVAPLLIIFFVLGGWTSFWQQLIAIDPNLGTYAFGTTGIAGVSIVFGWIVYGIGTIGQPHVMQRHLTAKDDKTIKTAAWIGMTWYLIVMTGSNLLGLCARILYPNIVDAEYVFPMMVVDLSHPILAGIVIAAIFSAIASTYSSQLMVVVQSISSDLYGLFSKKERTQKESVKTSKRVMIIMGVVSVGVALLNIDTVFALVNYAWSALASSFGAALFLLLFMPHLINKEGTIVGMITGSTVATIWYIAGLGSYLHEIAPGMIACLITTIIVTKMTSSKYENKPEKPLKNKDIIR